MSMFTTFERGVKRLFFTKPASAYAADAVMAHGLHRSMSLFDLLCIGIGSTVGTGVFVLSGLIANKYSGPSAALSFLISGFACLFSAASYGELSSRIPSAGSTYAYAYYALGEYPAVLAAWALTLEYGSSGAAVARSWGDKMAFYIEGFGYSLASSLDAYGINLFAGILMFACVIILLLGVDIGKFTVNAFTVFKVILVMFMIITGLAFFNPINMTPAAPYGFSGIMRGATASFFGLVGFDEVCCMAAEAQRPNIVLPRAVFGTIVITTLLYSFAAFALTGMQPSSQISTQNGFGDAFRHLGLGGIAHIVSVGELLCLPVVALVSFMAQPRLQYAMATDGLMPKLFAEIDGKGNLTKGIWVGGLICTGIALFVPFTYLDDMISAGVLFSFSLSNTALVLIRRGQVESCDFVTHIWHPCSRYLLFFHVVAIALAAYVPNINSLQGPDGVFHMAVLLSFGVVEILVALLIYYQCPENADSQAASQYRVPWMPFPPLVGIVINYLLIAQLSSLGIWLMFLYFGLATAMYFVHCARSDWSVSLRHYEESNSPDKIKTQKASRTVHFSESTPLLHD